MDDQLAVSIMEDLYVRTCSTMADVTLYIRRPVALFYYVSTISFGTKFKECM